MIGRTADAAREMEIVLTAEPQLTVEGAVAVEPFAREQDRRHYADALRAAGVPERAEN